MKEKQKALLVILLLTLAIGIYYNQKPGREGFARMAPIVADGCKIGGCASQLCFSNSTIEGNITTCDATQESLCLQNAICGNINGTCQWQDTQEYLTCKTNQTPKAACPTWWVTNALSSCVSVMTCTEPASTYFATEAACKEFSGKITPQEASTEFTSKVNEKSITALQEYYTAQQEQQRQGTEPFWKTTSFWITLIVVIVIATIYGIWEKGPTRGFFKK